MLLASHRWASTVAVFALLVACETPSTRGQEPGELLSEARRLQSSGLTERALELYDRVLEQRPDDPDALYLRANVRYRAGRVAEALADFDRLAELVPDREPYLWQRGIAQYQIGRYEECAEQFEIHRTVNPADVENAAWHFLCMAGARGLEAARDGLLPVGRDARVPMTEVYELFAGQAENASVLEAARRQPEGPRRSSALLYAHLYLGLYAEARGDLDEARQELRRAVDLHVDGYMADVTRIHLDLLDPNPADPG